MSYEGPKFIQIALSRYDLYALDDIGQVWRFLPDTQSWVKVSMTLEG
jgi:hypothetical protein